MMTQRKTVSMLALFAVLSMMSLALFGGRSVRALDAEAAPVAARQEQLLASTMQIEMFGRGRVEGNLKHVPTARGLGTLVQVGDECFIMIHNHWSVPATELDRVEVHSAAGEPLLVLDGASFLSLLRYQDWGTMILAAPPQLPGVVPAPLGDGAALAAGDSVQLASQVAGGDDPVGVATAQVERADAARTPGLIELRGSDAPVAAGDSGGGIWHDGRLVGTLWAITVAPVDWPWSQWFGGAERPTGAILAGMQPLNGVADLFLDDLAPASAGEMDFERGPAPPAGE